MDTQPGILTAHVLSHPVPLVWGGAAVRPSCQWSSDKGAPIWEQRRHTGGIEGPPSSSWWSGLVWSGLVWCGLAAHSLPPGSLRSPFDTSFKSS